MGSIKVIFEEDDGTKTEVMALPTDFSTGSCGYRAAGSIMLKSKRGGDEKKAHSINLNIVESHSKKQ
jgi:hypothetical protein